MSATDLPFTTMSHAKACGLLFGAGRAAVFTSLVPFLVIGLSGAILGEAVRCYPLVGRRLPADSRRGPGGPALESFDGRSRQILEAGTLDPGRRQPCRRSPDLPLFQGHRSSPGGSVA